jgi:hypothetical protein
MNNNTYLVTAVTKDKQNNEIQTLSTDYGAFNSLEDAKKHYNQLLACSNLYSANISKVLKSTDYDTPKPIINDFDYWINKLETVEQEITDWLSNNTDELYDEEPDIDSARNNLQEAIQDIHNHKASNTVAVPTSKCVNAVLDYILYSEMGGTYDQTDSWHSTYQQLIELRNDKIDPEELSHVSTNPSLQS